MGFFRGAFAGDEGRAQGRETRLSQGADNDKPACFRLAGFSDTDKIRVMVDAAGAREFHAGMCSVCLGCGLKSALHYEPCCVMWRLK
jgi:hypothetical protein